MNSDTVTHEALRAFGVVMYNYSENNYLKSKDVEGKADKSEIEELVKDYLKKHGLLLELDDQGDFMPVE